MAFRRTIPKSNETTQLAQTGNRNVSSPCDTTILYTLKSVQIEFSFVLETNVNFHIEISIPSIKLVLFNAKTTFKPNNICDHISQKYHHRKVLKALEASQSLY